MNRKLLKAAALSDEMLLKLLIPGRGGVTQKVRDQIKSFASNISARSVLLLGPVGAGKSTVARVMALMRYLHICPDERRQRIVEHLKFDGPFRIEKKLLSWFEEVNLTGLTDELAQAQLFGVAKKAATGVDEREGIFERAMNGHSPNKESIPDAARLTGGVVLIDEIGDFSLRLQPLLLLLLTGAEVFRLGGEGDPKYGYSFRGVTIAATWKDPFDGSLRHDLLSRLANYVIRIPSLNDRKDEFDDIIGEIVIDINDRHSEYIVELERENPNVVSRAKIEQEKKHNLNVGCADIDLLKAQDWSKRGDLRGLRQILERCFYEGITVAEAAESHVVIEPTMSPQGGDIARGLIEEICRCERPTTFTREVNRVEGQLRNLLASRLKNDPGLRRRVAESLGSNDQDLRRQLNDLIRDRGRGRNENH